MFIVILRFSENRSKAGELMAAHNDWLGRGFDDGIFLLAGSLQLREGGAIVAHDVSRSELETRVKADPFVAQDVVKPEIVEIAPSKADARLDFLLP